MKKIVTVLIGIVMCASGFSEEITRHYFAPVYKTKINDDKVNVRILPGIRYKKVSQLNRGDIVLVTGISSKREVIDNYDGYWLRIDSEDEKELLNALKAAEKYENTILIEDMITGREFSCGIFAGKALPIIEIIPKTGFYDYKNKYQKGLTTEI